MTHRDRPGHAARENQHLRRFKNFGRAFVMSGIRAYKPLWNARSAG
jgi:hypothetical protein